MQQGFKQCAFCCTWLHIVGTETTKLTNKGSSYSTDSFIVQSYVLCVLWLRVSFCVVKVICKRICLTRFCWGDWTSPVLTGTTSLTQPRLGPLHTTWREPTRLTVTLITTVCSQTQKSLQPYELMSCILETAHSGCNTKPLITPTAITEALSVKTTAQLETPQHLMYIAVQVLMYEKLILTSGAASVYIICVVYNLQYGY